MKKLYITLTVFLIIAIELVVANYINSFQDEDLYESEVETHARISQNIPEEWKSISETTQTVASVIFYDENSTNYIFSIYLNEGNVPSGFSLIAGGAIPVNQYQIAEMFSKR